MRLRTDAKIRVLLGSKGLAGRWRTSSLNRYAGFRAQSMVVGVGRPALPGKAATI